DLRHGRRLGRHHLGAAAALATAPRTGDRRARAAHLTMLGDWILYRLSGRYVTDPSLGSSSGLFDLAARGGSGRLLEICGLQAAVCPEVLEPGTVIGGVRRQAADETGLAEGTPVVV